LEESEEDLCAHLHRRARRSLTTNPDFHTLRESGITWQVRAGYKPPKDVESFITHPTSFLKQGRSATVARLALGVDSSDIVIKAFHPKGRALRELWNRFRGTRARRAFYRGHLLELLGIPTPRVLAYAEVARFPEQALSYLITDLVPGVPITTVWGSMSALERRNALEELGTILGRLHRARCSHRDLKGRNVLWSKDSGFSLLDLDSLDVLSRAVSSGRQLSDLRRLAKGVKEVTGFRTRDALQFAKAYVSAFGKGNRRELVRALL
jgi:tRNA A-37 threonylcarbamoyl transferase component Bud32